MSQQNLQLVQGEGLIPHESNPQSASVEDDVKTAMKEAEEKAEDKSEDRPEGEEVVEAVEEGLEAVKEGEAEAGGLEPPASWTAAQQDVFRSVPQETQEFLLDLEESVVSPLQEQLQSLQPYQQMAQQWDPYFQQSGVPGPQIIGQLLQADLILKTGTPAQKADLLNNLVRHYQIPLGEETVALPENLADDPVASALAPELQEVRQGLASLQAQMGNQFAALQQNQAQQQKAAIEQMASAVDGEGKPKYPHFNEVRPYMESLAVTANSTGQQVTWDSLYEQACRAHPSVWPKIQSAERAAGVAKRKAVAADKQRASSSVSGSPAGSRVVKEDPNESVHDTVMRAFELHSGGGDA